MDGVLDGTAAKTGVIETTTHELTLLSRAGSSLLDGTVDDARIYSGSISLDIVKAINARRAAA